MYRMSVMYPTKEGAHFDFDYYRQTHMPLALVQLEPYGMIRYEIDKGISALGGQQGPYVCVGHLYFESLEDYEKGIAEVGPELREDIPNYTNITPIRQFAEILEE